MYRILCVRADIRVYAVLVVDRAQPLCTSVVCWVYIFDRHNKTSYFVQLIQCNIALKTSQSTTSKMYLNTSYFVMLRWHDALYEWNFWMWYFVYVVCNTCITVGILNLLIHLYTVYNLLLSKNRLMLVWESINMTVLILSRSVLLFTSA